MAMDGNQNIALELDLGAQSQVGFSTSEQTPATCFRNLYGHFYDGKMILSFKALFNSDAAKEVKSLKGLKCSENRFIMPKQIKYNDYINKGYDELVKQHKAAKKQGKLDQKPEPVRSHKLLTLNLEAVQGMLQGARYAFLTFEPIYEGGASHEESEDIEKLTEKRNYELKKQIGEIVEDLIIQPQVMLEPRIQISQAFEVENYQNKIVDEKLQCWINMGVKKVLISIISSDSQEELEKYRTSLAEKPLMQSYNIKGITLKEPAMIIQ